MNAFMHQACCITAAAKLALRDKTAIAFTPDKYDEKIEFQFMPEKGLLRAKVYKAKSVSEWYKHCLKNGLQDVAFLTHSFAQKCSDQSFSNKTDYIILCYYSDRVTYFSAIWDHNPSQEGWSVLYTENNWKDAPLKRPHYRNDAVDLQAILPQIKELAIDIDCPEFAPTFQEALDILAGSDPSEMPSYMALPRIPEANRRLYHAACVADVFGGMCSWNDSPPNMAHDKGLDDKYESLSEELAQLVQFAILYAINEW